MINPLHQGMLRLYEGLTGRRILAAMARLESNDHLSREELLERQREKLLAMLLYAGRYVPYYSALFGKIGFRPQELRKDPRYLRKLPILSKATLRERGAEFLTTEPARRRTLVARRTSGSTGAPLDFYVDRNFRDYYTAFAHYHFGWSGWRPWQRYAYLTRFLSTISRREALRRDAMDRALNRYHLRLDLEPELALRRFLRETRRHPPALLYGFTRQLMAVAEFLEEQEGAAIRPRAVYTTGDLLEPQQRAVFAQAFQAPVFDQYSAGEIGGIAGQCEQGGGLHVNMESVYVEIVDQDGQPAGPGEPGEIILTPLNNYGMPLIRYNLEDVVAWHPQERCSCGRPQPLLKLVYGRARDFMRRRDGRIAITAGTAFMREIPGARQYQIIQKNLDLVLIRIVAERALSEEELQHARRGIAAILGEGVETRFEFPDELPLEPSGKFRYLRSELGE